MSKCCQCEKEATVQLVDIDVHGRMREAFLCEKHAKACGVFTPNTFQLIDGLPTQDRGILLSNHLCPSCGCTREWLEENKRVGCPQCYQTFTALKPHGFKNVIVYFGKIPASQQNAPSFQPRLQYLQEKLKKLMERECFEAAKTCQKQIQLIEKILKTCTK